MLIEYKHNKGINVTNDKDILTATTVVPKFVLVNKFNEAAAKDFREDFAEALETGQETIPVVIDSYGGHVYSLLSMVDTIASSPKPVITYTTGKAMSCGAVLFTCGEKRYMDKTATIMIHDVSSWSHGKVGDLEIDLKESKRLNKLIYSIMEKNIDKNKGYLWKMCEDKNRGDWFITSKDALKHNIATDIGAPKMTVSVSIKTEIK
jgi:ATP-dependent Clp protease protease subunit